MKKSFLSLVALGAVLSTSGFAAVSYRERVMGVQPMPYAAQPMPYGAQPMPYPAQPMSYPGQPYPVQPLPYPPMPVPQAKEYRLYRVNPNLVRMDVIDCGRVRGSIIDILELRNRLMGYGFTPPQVDYYVNQIAMPQLINYGCEVPPQMRPIVEATEAVFRQFGRMPF